MAGNRDWEKELSKIDGMIQRLPEVEDEPAPAPLSQRPAAAAPEGRARTPSLPAGPGVPAGAQPLAPALPSRWAIAGTWALSLIALAGAAAVTVWPFGSRCGVELALYGVALVGTAGVGLWTAVRSWKARTARPHIIGIAVLVWALALGAREVLPRVGAALPSVERPAIWSCG